jgi:hypothetical protein
VYSSLGCQMHLMGDLDQLRKKTVLRRNAFLLYVNTNHKKYDALQKALALLISSEKSHSSF